MSLEIGTGQPTASAGGVQSLHRALDLLEIVSSRGGHMAIGEIAVVSDIPLPTIHRLLKTLVERGYMRQLPNRRYALGFRLLPLGLTANALLGADTGPSLARLVAELGETANLAILSEDHAEYVAQVPSPHAMRMFTEVGRRVELHCTGVGKALLAQLDERDVSAIVRRIGLSAMTSHTITTELALHSELQRIKLRGYSIDEEEQELGVRCIAVAVPGEFLSPMAISVSGPLTRVTESFVERAVPLLLAVAGQLGDEIA
ncbi:MAG: transcriptional regulator, IclR family, partial [Microbacteriaceae bacterium]|nr:transcriptional regulator, IclR family [Microbacteriaceae bacterium]